MRTKISSVLLLCLLSLGINAQISFPGGRQVTTSDTIKVVMFNGLNASSELVATGRNNSTISWYKFTAPTVAISTVTNQATSSISPDDATGYIVDIDGKKYYIWVIDYQKYLPNFTSLAAEQKPTDQCKEVKLLLNGAVTELSYQNPQGKKVVLPRRFNVDYTSLKWDGKAWGNLAMSSTFVLPGSDLKVTAPLCNTTFKISGDQYAELLGIDKISTISQTYNAVAVECHITTSVTARNELQEADKPQDKTPINYSAPIDVYFKSNGNEPVSMYYKWEVFSGKVSILNRSDKEHRYTFNQSGKYKVVVTASNAYCNYTDSINIEVTESALQVPNVFTPNGDGVNDEFRVAYKSLASFQCWIYNRWGRKVYYFDNPQKGWNGYIGNKQASAGPYFYVIKAQGTDGVKYSKKGDVSLLR